VLDISPLTETDIEDSHRLSAQAGWNQVISDWDRLLAISSNGCFAGRIDGKLVGTTCVITYSDTVSWIGMVLVDQKYRRKGYGTRLFEHGLEFARGLKSDAIGLDATGYGAPLYQRYGFENATRIERWSGELSNVSTPYRATVLSPNGVDDLFKLDQQTLGVDRSKLLEALLSGIGVSVLGIYDDDEELVAYTVLRPGAVHPHVGPVIAPDVEHISALLNRVRAILTTPKIIIDAFPSPALTARLEEHGLTPERELHRMTHESDKSLLVGNNVRAAAGFEWG
jgi:GNAT superfamily N-acetyltransferase